MLNFDITRFFVDKSYHIPFNILLFNKKFLFNLYFINIIYIYIFIITIIYKILLACLIYYKKLTIFFIHVKNNNVL